MKTKEEIMDKLGEIDRKIIETRQYDLNDTIMLDALIRYHDKREILLWVLKDQEKESEL
jgi:hypothetical protein